jgi:retron-type reverse transcriptase
MGDLIQTISDREHILACYHLIQEKFYDPSLSLFKKSAAGIDGLEHWEFHKNLEGHIDDCQEFLRSGTREFQPQILTKVPKDEAGKFREIYLLSMRDKVVHKAIAEGLGQALEKYFYPNLFSYRRGKYYGSIAAARRVRKLMEQHGGKLFVFKADIASYFDNIDQEMLLEKFTEIFPDEVELWQLLKKFIRQRRLDGGTLYSPTLGIPTGSPLSPLCANFYLMELDRQMFRGGFNYLRYGDDVLLLDPDMKRIEQGRGLIEQILAGHALKLSAKKTQLYRPGEPFDYLGYRFDGTKIQVGGVALKRFKEWVYELLPRDKYQYLPNKTEEDRKELLGKILTEFNTGMAATLNIKQLPYVRAFPIVNDDTSFKEMDRFIKNRIRLAITRRNSPKNYRLVPEAWFRELGFKSLTGAYYRIIRRRSLAPYRGWRRYFGTNFESFLEGRDKKTTGPLKRLKRNLDFVRKAMNGELL